MSKRANKFNRLPVVEERVGISKSRIYLLMSKGLFPKNISVGNGRAVAWLESDIDEWIEQRIAASKA